MKIEKRFKQTSITKHIKNYHALTPLHLHFAFTLCTYTLHLHTALKMAPKVQGKRTFTKIDTVSNADILEWAKTAAEAGEPLFSLDIEGESKSENMKKHDIRYLKMVIRKPDGKYVHFRRDAEAFKTASKPDAGKVEEGKRPSAIQLQERILVPDDKKTVEEFIDERFKEMDLDLPEKKMTKLVKKEIEYAKNCKEQWAVLELINGEFIRMLNDSDFRKKISWVKKKDYKIQGNIQYYRDQGEDETEDDYKADPLYDEKMEMVRLLFPIIRHRIKIDKNTGKPYKKIQEVVKDKPEPILAVMPNSEGNMEPVDCDTILEWLTMNSIVQAQEAYQVCLHGKGASLHAMLDDIMVLRGEPLRGKRKVDKAAVNKLRAMRGDDSDEEAPANVDTEETVRQSVVDKMKKVALNDQDEQRKELDSDAEDNQESQESKEESKEEDAKKEKKGDKKSGKKGKKTQEDDE